MKDPSRLPELLLFLLLFSCASIAAAQAPASFTPTGNMTTPRIGHTATLLLNGKVLITGGGNPVTGGSSAELYDPVTGTFTATGNMMTRRGGHSATLLPDGRVLIAGGFPDFVLAAAELYDPSTETFTPTGNMVTAQFGHTATLLDNAKVLIAGGAGGLTDCCPYTDVAVRPELYDPVTGTFTATGDYADRAAGSLYGSVGLLHAPATLLSNGKVLIAAEPTAELYDPVSGRFSLTGQMTTGISPVFGPPGYIEGRTATMLTNGNVLLTGGIDDLRYFANAELYDPATGKFTAIGNMTRTREAHTATLLRDGAVLIAGSQNGGGPVIAGAELYDPATGRFTATADMTSPRFFHTATLLMDGRILMTGGYTSYPASPNSNSAELFVPPVLVPAQVVTDLRFEQTRVVAGSSYSANISGSNLTPQTFLDVRFTAPGSNAFNVVLNWQKGTVASHGVPTGTASGPWTIVGVRAHQVETDHTGNLLPVNATITVSP